MSSKIKGNEKGVVTGATGFQGVATPSEFCNGNIFDKITPRTLN